MTDDLKSLTTALFIDKEKKYQALAPAEKYKICVNVITVQPRDIVAPLLCDSAHWRGILGALGLRVATTGDIASYTREERQALGEALHRAGHPRGSPEALVAQCRQALGVECCDAYCVFNALFVPEVSSESYGRSARQLISEYNEARCSNLCQRQALPLHCYNGAVFFCSAECRLHYVQLLDAI